MRFKPTIEPIEEPSRARETSSSGPRQRADALGPLDHERLRQRVGDNNYTAWLSKMEVASLAADGTLTVTAPTKLIRERIRSWFEPDILACTPGATRLVVQVAEADPSNARSPS
jgi:hypothetical protein